MNHTIQHKLSGELIAKAKAETIYSPKKLGIPLHQHDDCIRICFEWLDAQKIIKSKCKHQFAIKHLIEQWAGRYVSMSDVEVAAKIHPQIIGIYPHYNISSKLVEPDKTRLKNIVEANKHEGYKSLHYPVGHAWSLYKITE
jgi:hypothetical protein